MIEPAIRQVLINDMNVHPIVGDRIWFQIRPQGERRPGIVLTRTGGSDPGNIDGPAGFTTGTIQVDVLAPTYKDVKSLAAKVASALDGFSDQVGSTRIDYLTVEDVSDIPAVPPEGGAVPSTFGVSIDLSFMCQP